MARCVIFCAGGFDRLIAPLETGDFVIAADGGLRHVQALDAAPDLILGDFDSLGYVPEGAEQHPVEKDDTDAMLAARRGLEKGCDRFLFYGGLEGERLDHTVANFQTLQFLADQGAKGCFVGQNQIVTLVKNGSLQFPPQAQGTVSVFCMGRDAKGVSIEGTKYTLTNGTLTAGFPLGVSNQFTDRQAVISVGDGSLLVIYERKNGIVW